MSKTIMTVDDSASIRQMVSFTLKKAGYQVIEASDGKDALSKLSGPLHMVITDLNMPNMDGLELIGNIRGSAEFQDLPIIMLTTEDSSENRQLAHRAGADLYLVKPAPSHMILFKVESLLLARAS